MDIKAIAEQVLGTVQNAPEKIQGLLSDPKGAIEEITGQAIGEEDIAGIMEHVEGALGQAGVNADAILESLGNNIGDALNNILGGFKK